MKKYKVLAPGGLPIAIGSIIKVTEKQAKRHRHVLKKLDGVGCYEVVETMSFKNQETFESDMDLSSMFKIGMLEMDGQTHDPTQGKRKKKKSTEGPSTGGSGSDESKYKDYSIEDLKAEIAKRDISHHHSAGIKKLTALLDADDKAKEEAARKADDEGNGGDGDE